MLQCLIIPGDRRWTPVGYVTISLFTQNPNLSRPLEIVCYVTITVYLHKTPSYSHPWNKTCCLMITMDRPSLSKIHEKYDYEKHEKLLVLVCPEAEADGHWADQWASIKMWIKCFYWLINRIKSLLASGSVQTSTSTITTRNISRSFCKGMRFIFGNLL